MPQEWQHMISANAAASGRRESEIVREAIGQYLGKTDSVAVKGANASLEDRVAWLERKLVHLGKEAD